MHVMLEVQASGGSALQYQNELDTVLEQLAEANHRLERLYDAAETGKIPLADLATRIHELRNRQEEIDCSEE